MEKFGRSAEKPGSMRVDKKFSVPRPRATPKGRSAVLQAKLALLVMINLAQLWILSAAVEAALARHFRELLPLVIASAVCWGISLTIVLWWKPSRSKRATIGVE